jgi:hypothetical protein
VVVKDIASPALPDVAVAVVWLPDTLLSKASRTFISLAVRLARATSIGAPRES